MGLFRGMCLGVMVAMGTGGVAFAQDAPAAGQAPVAATVGAAAAPAAASAGKTSPAKGKKEKEVYTGPTEIIVLPATPMLDAEGEQMLDPDGKPMFNAPVKQQRDKKGHPLFDDKGKPVFQTATEVGYDENGKKLHPEKVKPPKMTPVAVSRGTFTVDGVIGKAELNYDIADLKFIYLYVPGAGVTVVSGQMFKGAVAEPAAFDGNTLTVKANEHVLQLTSDKRLLQDKKPVVAYVMVDRNFSLPSRYPEVGYGTISRAPYEWPGSKAYEEPAGVLDAVPPVPKNLTPKLALSPCPKGQMRSPTLPGDDTVQPCVAISVAMAGTQTAKPAATPAPVAQPVSAPQ